MWPPESSKLIEESHSLAHTFKTRWMLAPLLLSTERVFFVQLDDAERGGHEYAPLFQRRLAFMVLPADVAGMRVVDLHRGRRQSTSA